MNLMEYYRNVIGKSLFRSTHKIDNEIINASKIPPERVEEMLRHQISTSLANYIKEGNPDFFTVKNDGSFTTINCELVIMTKERFIEIFKDISNG